MTHPAAGIDDIVHQRARLAILVLTQEATKVEFTYLRDALGLTAGNLSRHLSVLVEAGLVTTAKDDAVGRARTWVRITPRGRAALRREVRLLDELVAPVRPHPGPAVAPA